MHVPNDDFFNGQSLIQYSLLRLRPYDRIDCRLFVFRCFIYVLFKSINYLGMVVRFIVLCNKMVLFLLTVDMDAIMFLYMFVCVLYV